MPYSQYSPGQPSLNYVKPGLCQFTENFGADTAAALISRAQISGDTFVFTFELPDKTKPLNLSTCACILAKGPNDENGDAVVRPYTPVSTNDMVGKFELMVKVYDQGKMTQYLKNLEIGTKVEFKHINFNVKIQYPFGKKTVCMIVGGTGITPMIQAMHAILGDSNNTETEVRMLYGSNTPNDILGNEFLVEWEKQFPQRLKIEHVIANKEAADKAGWTGKTGFINAEMIKDLFPASNPEMMVFVCGPPPMYNAMCGPRDQKELADGTILKNLGYTPETVYKF